MNKKYRVRLTDEERKHLEKLVRRGKAHARILLKAAEDRPAQTNERIADAFEGGVATVARERQRYCEEGLEVALMPKKPGLPGRRVLDGQAEAHLIALACSDPPEGRDRRSSRLLADRMVESWDARSTSPPKPFVARSKNVSTDDARTKLRSLHPSGKP